MILTPNFLPPLLREASMFDRVTDNMRLPKVSSQPDYNIEKIGDNGYRISLAVPGFGEDDIEITVDNGTLAIAGKHGEKRSSDKDKENNFLYRGISENSFNIHFSLADGVEVDGADFDKGVLHVALHREQPQAEKVRRIAIGKAKA